MLFSTSIISQARKAQLTEDDVWQLDETFQTQYLGTKFDETWKKETEACRKYVKN
jgi:hypothetical protein